MSLEVFRVITGSKVRLRDKKIADARDDYNWQTDPELAELDAASLLTATFAEYLADYAAELNYPSANRRMFGVETLDGKHIGNCTCYGINEAKGEAEIGIMIGDRDYWDKGYGTDAVLALVDNIFCNSELRRIHLKTLTWNTRAQKSFKKCGFTRYGNFERDGYRFILMELSRKDWSKQRRAREPQS